MSDNDSDIDPTNVPADPPVPQTTVTVLKPRPLIVRLFTENNPFYLLSAACMLASCLALTNTMTWIPIAKTRLLTLLVTLNVYEFALLGIALFLVTRRGLRRDGWMLLILQAFFVVDFSFLNAEITTTDLKTGLIVNAVLFVLAAVKLGLVLRVLKPAFTRAQYAFVLVQFAVLFATPCVLKYMDANPGTVGPKHFYVLWWTVALIPALYEVVVRWNGNPPAVDAPSIRAKAAPTSAYLALPYISLLTHIGILHYVYNVDFYGAHAAPFLIGLTLILNRFSPTAIMPRKDLVALRLVLPFIAVLVSANNPFVFPIHSSYPYVTLTPASVALVAAFLTYVYCFLAAHAKLFLATGAAAGACYVFGPSRQQIGDATTAAWETTSTFGERMVPRTVGDWGIIGLVASFAFLAIGFWVSMAKRPVEFAEEVPDSLNDGA